MMPPRSLGGFVAALLIAAPAGLLSQTVAAEAVPDTGNWAARVAAAEHRRDSNIREVRSVRRYVLHNPRWDHDPTMVVMISYTPNGKKRYEILDMRAEGFQKQVFRRLLDGEVETSAQPEEDGAITPENYQLTPVGYETIAGRRCLVVNLKPRRKSKLLLEGRAWIDVQEAAPVRLEGRPSKSYGFWVGRPHIVQDFRKVGGYWLSSQNYSSADVKLVGKTELTVQFLDYSVTPRSGEVQMACAGTCSPRLRD